MSLNSQQTLHHALPIVAAAYGRTFGVQVQVGGDQARTNGRLIQIPTLSEESDSKTLAYGYLAHEAGHVRLSDFTLPRHPQPLGRFLEGVLEDVRIESAMIRTYPGTRATLDAVIVQLLRKGRMRAVRATDPPGPMLSHAVLMLARYRYRDQSMLAPQAEQAQRVLRQVFGPAFVERLQALLAQIPTLASTAEAMALARRILALLEATSQGSEGAQGSAGAETSEGSEGSGAQEETDAQGTPQGSQAAAEASGSAQQDGQDAQGTPAHAPEDASQDGGSVLTSEGAHGSGEGPAHAPVAGAQTAETAQSDASEHAAPAAAARSQAAHAALSASDASLPEDLFETIGGLLQAQAMPSREALPALEVFQGDAVRGAMLLRRVKGHSARLTARLQGLVQAERMTRSRTVRQGRTLSAEHLHRVGVGDGRVFRVRSEQAAPNTALHLLVDLSGSMADGEDRLALEAAMALALALEPINGVSRAVSAFPGRQGQSDQLTQVVAHGERVAARAGAFVQTARGGTPMTGALWFAAADLLAQPAPRKVLITLSDGEPNHRPSVLALVRRAQAAGLELIGIGIGHEVGHLFPKALRIDAIADLKRALFEVAEQLLVSRRG
ncbi:cobaltochelatase CobT-related protein [Halochromatium salexigens]|uniref:VWA domain-containing protein n=1 Tax=Halochromatium salexigens TaxID=49447 RepID=A0AAJ0XFP5_HALSE|nr:VWA domain-containing protein [Halochromatium salexigens]MBK5929897.1 VWA domain-containing protein [Halochromatium salexigens]